MSHFVGAGKPAISLAHLDIDKPAPTNPVNFVRRSLFQFYAVTASASDSSLTLKYQ
jgi:hypothetical protein